jgi:hypothetical protein
MAKSTPTDRSNVLNLRTKLQQEPKKPEIRAEIRAEREVEGVTGSEPKAGDEAGVLPARHEDGFGFRGNTAEFEHPSGISRTENVQNRLAALSKKGRPLIKARQSDVPRTRHTEGGKVLEGVLRAETAAGLAGAEGVIAAQEIALNESRIKGADLQVLNSLERVARFTIEGSPTLQNLDLLSKLTDASNLYVGFNKALTRIALNLTSVGKLIIEGNDALTEIRLTNLSRGTLIEIRDNPSLETIIIGDPKRPAELVKLDVGGNKKKSYPGIFVTIVKS